MDSSDYIPEEERVLYSNYFPFQGVDEEDSWVDSGDPNQPFTFPAHRGWDANLKTSPRFKSYY